LSCSDVSRGKKLSRVFTIYDRDFDIHAERSRHFDMDIGKPTLRRNFDGNVGRAACEAPCAAFGNLGTNSAFVMGRRMATEIVGGVRSTLIQ
jgi:hypothetical protein